MAHHNDARVADLLATLLGEPRLADTRLTDAKDKPVGTSQAASSHARTSPSSRVSDQL